MVNRPTYLALAAAGLLVSAGCVATPDGENTEEELAADECPSFKIAVVVRGHLQCVDEEILQREREVIENEERW